MPVDKAILTSFSQWLDSAIADHGVEPVFAGVLATAIFEVFRRLPEKEGTKLIGEVVEAVREEAKAAVIH